mgnify:CR=1 FL=1
MGQLLLQIIFRQWDKGQRSEADVQQRAALPDRYSVALPPAQSLFGGNVILDCHGDDRLGNRLQYRQTPDHSLLIDRFRIDSQYQQLVYSDDTSLCSLGTLRKPWVQCRYQWRYRVQESGLIYWLYEEVILNAARSERFEQAIFVSSEPAEVHGPLSTPASSRPFYLAR